MIHPATHLCSRSKFAPDAKRTKMKIPRLWKREERGNLLRAEYDDLRRRIDAAEDMSRPTCFNHIRSTFGPVSEGYALASDADRERILREIREVSRQLWNAGNPPQA